MSGLYHSVDDGGEFSMTYAATIDGGPGCRVQYTPTQGWLYAVDKKYPGGLPACSLDGGASWTPASPDPTAGNTRRLFADELGGRVILLADKTALYASPMPRNATCDAGSLDVQMVFNATEGQELFASGAFILSFIQPPSHAAAAAAAKGAAAAADDSDDDTGIVLVGTAQGVLFSSDGGVTFTLLPSTGLPDGEAILSFSAGVVKNDSNDVNATAAADADDHDGDDDDDDDDDDDNVSSSSEADDTTLHLALHAVTADLSEITDDILMERNEGLKLAKGVYRATLNIDLDLLLPSAAAAGAGAGARAPPTVAWERAQEGLPPLLSAGGTAGSVVST